ncbi:MAG: hypothetical protein ACLTZB_05070 [Streptococcus salivarius]
MPTKNKRVATIDLMRYDFEKAPKVSGLLFVKLFQYFQAEGKQYLIWEWLHSRMWVLKKIVLEEKVANLVYVFATFLLFCGSNVIRRSSLQYGLQNTLFILNELGSCLI